MRSRPRRWPRGGGSGPSGRRRAVPAGLQGVPVLHAQNPEAARIIGDRRSECPGREEEGRGRGEEGLFAGRTTRSRSKEGRPSEEEGRPSEEEGRPRARGERSRREKSRRQTRGRVRRGRTMSLPGRRGPRPDERRSSPRRRESAAPATMRVFRSGRRARIPEARTIVSREKEGRLRREEGRSRSKRSRPRSNEVVLDEERLVCVAKKIVHPRKRPLFEVLAELPARRRARFRRKEVGSPARKVGSPARRPSCSENDFFLPGPSVFSRIRVVFLHAGR